MLTQRGLTTPSFSHPRHTHHPPVHSPKHISHKPVCVTYFYCRFWNHRRRRQSSTLISKQLKGVPLTTRLRCSFLLQGIFNSSKANQPHSFGPLSPSLHRPRLFSPCNMSFFSIPSASTWAQAVMSVATWLASLSPISPSLLPSPPPTPSPNYLSESNYVTPLSKPLTIPYHLQKHLSVHGSQDRDLVLEAPDSAFN